MAAIGFVLITTDVGKEQKVFTKLEHVKGIIELYMTHGEYDLVVKIKADTPDNITSITNQKIRAIPDVISVKTLMGPEL